MVQSSSRLIPLSEIVENYAPVYPAGGTWQDTVDLMKNDETEWEVVTHLMNYLKTNPHFREPIALQSKELLEEDRLYDEEEGIVDENHDYNTPNVLNGTHRMVASILSGAETVLAEMIYPETPPNVSSLVAVTKVYIEEPALNEEEIADFFFDHARSFPVNENVWVTSSTAYGRSGYYETYWENHPDELNDEILDEINQAFIDRIAAKGIGKVRVLTCMEDMS